MMNISNKNFPADAVVAQGCRGGGSHNIWSDAGQKVGDVARASDRLQSRRPGRARELLSIVVPALSILQWKQILSRIDSRKISALTLK